MPERSGKDGHELFPVIYAMNTGCTHYDRLVKLASARKGCRFHAMD
jgi:hypothetical protein